MLRLELDAQGLGQLWRDDLTDGYCEDGDCAAHTKLLSFVLPKGAKLVPHPDGTMPPQTPDQWWDDQAPK